MITIPTYCPRCCRNARMHRTRYAWAFLCPRGHVIAVLDYLTAVTAYKEGISWPSQSGTAI